MYLLNHIITPFIFNKILSNIPEARRNLTSFFIQAKDFLPISTRESELYTKTCSRTAHFSNEEIDSFERFL